MSWFISKHLSTSVLKIFAEDLLECQEGLTSTGLDNCQDLCFGRGYRTHVVEEIVDCECWFVLFVSSSSAITLNCIIVYCLIYW